MKRSVIAAFRVLRSPSEGKSVNTSRHSRYLSETNECIRDFALVEKPHFNASGFRIFRCGEARLALLMGLRSTSTVTVLPVTVSRRKHERRWLTKSL